MSAFRNRSIRAFTRVNTWTQAHDLAAGQPEKLAELQELFMVEARKYNVLPVDARRFERFNADLAVAMARQ